MECMLHPQNPVIPPIKIPYLSKSRYDGGEWLSYPRRMGKAWAPQMPGGNIGTVYYVYHLSHTVPMEEQEAFLQTWLFFGLICEALGGNVLLDGQPGLQEPAPSEIINQVYQECLYEEDGKNYISTASLLSRLEATFQPSFTNDRENIKRRVLNLIICLQQAWRLFYNLPSQFDRMIRLSIGAVGEILSHAVNAAQRIFQTNYFVPIIWGQMSSGEEGSESKSLIISQQTMLKNGWCPSDLTRNADKFKSIQWFYYLSLLDKREPGRDHGNCTEIQCRAHQIDMSKYDVSHAEEGCDCARVEVNNDEVVRVLEKEHCIPLLRFVGDKEKLKIEIVESSEQTSYVAISHVWADGLGNPFANALHSCQLVKLRTQVEALIKSQHPNHSTPNNAINPLIWLDTLCCPVRPPAAKALSLTKMAQVYQCSASVLVLDASLQCYSATEMDIIERVARISTSNWLRRLWTLQEGALAQNLYFQFADGPLSLDVLQNEIAGQGLRFLRHRIIWSDIIIQFNELQRFFHAEKYNLQEADLQSLDSALMHRGVSVLSDEAICIATLMKLPPTPVITALEEDRMQVIWRLLAEKHGGIPAEVIFSEGIRLMTPGFRWAPSSFLNLAPQLQSTSVRSKRWISKPGKLTPHGLRVTYPGFALRSRDHADDRPRNPWLGLPRVAENRLVVRHDETQDWFSIIRVEYARISRSWSDEERRAYNKEERFPLHDLLQKEGTYIIILDEGASSGTVDIPPAEAFMGIVVSVDASLIGDPDFDDGDGALPVRIEDHVIIGHAVGDTVLVYETIERLARKLRSDPLTDRLLSFSEEERDGGNDAVKECITQLKEKMKAAMQVAFEDNPEARVAVKRLMGEDMDEHVWVEIANWFYHDFTVSRLDGGHVWVVD